MKKILFLTAAVALASTSTAHANDFTGFRVEAQTGLDVFSGKESYKWESTIDGVADDSDSETYRGNATGAQFGLGVGYDAEITPNIIAGIEGGITFSNAKFKNIDYGIDLDDEEYFEADNLKAKREIDLGARIGYKVNPSTLVYLKGGYVNGRFKLNGETEFFDEEEDEYVWRDQSFSENRSGYRVGGGIETLLGSNAFVKLEYRYTNFKDIKWTTTFENDDYREVANDRLGLSRHQVALGLGVRF